MTKLCKSNLLKTPTTNINKLYQAHITLAWILVTNLPFPLLSYRKVASRYKLATITCKLLSVIQSTYLHLLLEQYHPIHCPHSDDRICWLYLQQHPPLACALSYSTHSTYLIHQISKDSISSNHA